MRVCAKLDAAGIHPLVTRVLAAWLAPRSAHVIVNGQASVIVPMRDMVYQGTALGPPLWNTYFAGASCAVGDVGFEQVAYADDLNSCWGIPRQICDAGAFALRRACQQALHCWGRGNAVAFDPSKESMHILSRRDAVGPNFTLLGTEFDCKLVMDDAVRSVVTQANCKLRMLLRTQRFHNDADLVLLFKSHILSFIEFRTAALPHASTSVLEPLDAVQRRFLQSVSATELEALVHFKLAPLHCRRDMAMLAVIHRTLLGDGPRVFERFFQRDSAPLPPRAPRRHDRHVRDPCQLHWPDYATRSALGAVKIYNLLPDSIVSAENVHVFQRRLQKLVIFHARSDANWSSLFSWRQPLYAHALRSLRDWQ